MPICLVTLFTVYCDVGHHSCLYITHKFTVTTYCDNFYPFCSICGIGYVCTSVVFPANLSSFYLSLAIFIHFSFLFISTTFFLSHSFNQTFFPFKSFNLTFFFFLSKSFNLTFFLILSIYFSFFFLTFRTRQMGNACKAK